MLTKQPPTNHQHQQQQQQQAKEEGRHNKLPIFLSSMTTTSSSRSSSNMWLAASSAVLVLVASWFLAYPQPDLNLEEDILPLARAYASVTDSSSMTPLEGVRVVITGATGGIGLGLVERFVQMGATIIALGRSPQKLQALVDQFSSSNKIVPIQVQLTDLASVQKAANEIASQFDQIDILINNAGIHYQNILQPQNNNNNNNGTPPTTPQGWDMSWGVNYMSHFLLTEKLLPLLKQSNHQPTVIQISSSFHWAVDGSDLATTTTNQSNHNNNTMKNPRAAIPGVFTKGGGGMFGSQRAYANSKLAQILHARALQRRHPDVVVKSICPCWVSTGIAGEFVGFFLLRAAYPHNGYGIKSALTAALDNNRTVVITQSLEESTSESLEADFYTNSPSTAWGNIVFPRVFYEPWFYQYRLRDAITMAFGGVLWTVQRFLAKVEARQSSPEAYQKDLQESLYDWSYRAVQPFLWTHKNNAGKAS